MEGREKRERREGRGGEWSGRVGEGRGGEGRGGEGWGEEKGGGEVVIPGSDFFTCSGLLSFTLKCKGHETNPRDPSRWYDKYTNFLLKCAMYTHHGEMHEHYIYSEMKQRG